MRSKAPDKAFVEQLQQQLLCLRDPQYRYRALRVHVAGATEPWEFVAQDELEIHDDLGLLIVRDGPSDEAGHNNADVPEYVFRLDAVVASQLV
jgi:hypothetical protein